MFTISIDGKDTECELNFGSALDYELEFGADIIADINGSVKQGGSQFITLDDKDNVVGIDFTAVPWTKLLRVLWIAAKTNNPKIKPFKKWAAETKGIDMFQARLLISSEIEECFFRNAPVVETEQGADSNE